MPKNGDTFTVPIGDAQLKWGTFRKPTNRNPVDGESYFAIPKEMAVKYGIFNSNHSQTGFGYNEFYASSRDGFINNEVLLAQGCSKAGDPYAKNFAVKGDLKRIGDWFTYCKATTANKVKVTFTSSSTLILEII